MALILDAGALIGFERGNRTVIAFIEVAQRERVPVRTTTAAVAQVWRSGALQVRLVRLLRGVDERSLDPSAARRIGELLASTHTADVVDGSIIDSAVSGDEVLTTDAADLAALAEAAGKHLTIVPMSA
ncbi:MAG: twitching motility protein PilT [Egibacteraceae bacterium]